VRDVVRIYARVAQEVPSVLVMVGDGPDRIDAEQEARHLGVQDRVFFLGKLEAVAPLLASADLFLLPTQSESFGLSALEALATGVPVIGTRAGGLPEVVRDGETGALCTVGDVEGMARAAVELLRDEAKWQAASTLAASDARERFSLDQVVAQYEAFYEDALRGTVRPDDASLPLTSSPLP
jgi:N-acetyl-alpha-D-glucosaminyl L-malate synthase BshA